MYENMGNGRWRLRRLKMNIEIERIEDGKMKDGETKDERTTDVKVKGI